MLERIVGLVKQGIVGSAKLDFKELQNTILDIQLVLKNQPLSYCKDDKQLLMLTRNMMIFGKANNLMKMSLEHMEQPDLRKKAKNLK